MIQAIVIADSHAYGGTRLTTLELTYPRFIHSELMTHRTMSRNASSSRAIPISKMIEWVKREPAMPIHWGKNQPGMQAPEECTSLVHLTSSLGGNCAYSREDAWRLARDNAVEVAEAMATAGYAKQIVNRILEPFAHIKVLVSATDWNNFFGLRLHKDAQPEIRSLAEAMKVVMDESTPKWIDYGHGWHLPYVSAYETIEDIEIAKKVSVARCARVSYLTHDNARPSIEADLKLYDRLVGSRPAHASPTEHVATPAGYPAQRHGNFTGWKQHRQELGL